jgi:type II secretory pathway component PulJ
LSRQAVPREGAWKGEDVSSGKAMVQSSQVKGGCEESKHKTRERIDWATRNQMIERTVIVKRYQGSSSMKYM